MSGVSRRGLAAWVVATVACAGPVRLEPSPGAMPVVEEPGGAQTYVHRVRFIASPFWPGEPEVRRAVTPLRLTVENLGDEPIALRYQDFVLVTRGGRRYPALPPFRIDASLRVWEESIRSPELFAEAFSVAPHYAPIYPTLRPYNGPFGVDALYYGAYQGFWHLRRIDLPTPEMRRLALPEGVLGPRGRLRGFLYFQKVSPRDRAVELRADVVRVRDGKRLGTAVIPFLVEPEGL